jgi:hypothetical protein
VLCQSVWYIGWDCNCLENPSKWLIIYKECALPLDGCTRTFLYLSTLYCQQAVIKRNRKSKWWNVCFSQTFRVPIGWKTLKTKPIHLWTLPCSFVHRDAQEFCRLWTNTDCKSGELKGNTHVGNAVKNAKIWTLKQCRKLGKNKCQ